MKIKADKGTAVIEFQKRELELADAFLTLLETLALASPFHDRAKSLQHECRELLRDAQGIAAEEGVP